MRKRCFLLYGVGLVLGFSFSLLFDIHFSFDTISQNPINPWLWNLHGIHDSSFLTYNLSIFPTQVSLNRIPTPH